MKNEPIIDYNHSLVLTSNDHVDKLKVISKKKTRIEEARAAKQRERKFTKERREHERLEEATTKKRRANKLKQRKNNQTKLDNNRN